VQDHLGQELTANVGALNDSVGLVPFLRPLRLKQPLLRFNSIHCGEAVQKAGSRVGAAAQEGSGSHDFQPSLRVGRIVEQDR